MSDNIHFRLKKIVEALNLTTYQIAKTLDENSSKFYNIMNGKTKPSYNTISKLIEKYPEINPDYIFKGAEPIIISSKIEGAIVDEHSFDEIPYLPIKFQASFIENYSDGIKYHDLGKYSVLKATLRNKKQPVVIEIQGNSMSPQLQSGNKVLASQILPSDWAYISGGVYAIIYRDFFVVKRIKDNDLLSKKTITLHSDNLKSGTITIPIEDIKGIWKITNI
ncbi:MAG: S24 family peptidase, partial [Bacteroidota bacterium]